MNIHRTSMPAIIKQFAYLIPLALLFIFYLGYCSGKSQYPQAERGFNSLITPELAAQPAPPNIQVVGNYSNSVQEKIIVQKIASTPDEPPTAPPTASITKAPSSTPSSNVLPESESSSNVLPESESSSNGLSESEAQSTGIDENIMVQFNDGPLALSCDIGGPVNNDTSVFITKILDRLITIRHVYQDDSKLYIYAELPTHLAEQIFGIPKSGFEITYFQGRVVPEKKPYSTRITISMEDHVKCNNLKIQQIGVKSATIHVQHKNYDDIKSTSKQVAACVSPCFGQPDASQFVKINLDDGIFDHAYIYITGETHAETIAIFEADDRITMVHFENIIDGIYYHSQYTAYMDCATRTYMNGFEWFGMVDFDSAIWMRDGSSILHNPQTDYIELALIDKPPKCENRYFTRICNKYLARSSYHDSFIGVHWGGPVEVKHTHRPIASEMFHIHYSNFPLESLHESKTQVLKVCSDGYQLEELWNLTATDGCDHW